MIRRLARRARNRYRRYRLEQIDREQRLIAMGIIDGHYRGMRKR